MHAPFCCPNALQWQWRLCVDLRLLNVCNRCRVDRARTACTFALLCVCVHRHYCSVCWQRNGIWGWNYDLIILYRTPINPSFKFKRTHKAIQTYALVVHGQRNAHSIHSTNEDERRAVIAIVVQWNGTCMRVTLPGMHYDRIPQRALLTNTFKFKHTQQCKRTSCWFSTITTSVPYVQQMKINAKPSFIAIGQQNSA